MVEAERDADAHGDGRVDVGAREPGARGRYVWSATGRRGNHRTRRGTAKRSAPAVVQVEARKEDGRLRDLEDVALGAEPKRDEHVGKVGMVLCGPLIPPVPLLSLPDLVPGEVRRRRDHGVQEALGRVVRVRRAKRERLHEAAPADEVYGLVREVEEDVHEALEERRGGQARVAWHVDGRKRGRGGRDWGEGVKGGRELRVRGLRGEGEGRGREAVVGEGRRGRDGLLRLYRRGGEGIKVGQGLLCRSIEGLRWRRRRRGELEGGVRHRLLLLRLLLRGRAVRGRAARGGFAGWRALRGHLGEAALKGSCAVCRRFSSAPQGRRWQAGAPILASRAATFPPPTGFLRSSSVSKSQRMLDRSLWGESEGQRGLCEAWRKEGRAGLSGRRRWCTARRGAERHRLRARGDQYGAVRRIHLVRTHTWRGKRGEVSEGCEWPRRGASRVGVLDLALPARSTGLWGGHVVSELCLTGRRRGKRMRTLPRPRDEVPLARADEGDDEDELVVVEGKPGAKSGSNGGA